jgi:ABC-type bacteriocin/lantibiotic exporter with double-glycine peptidase domain
VNQIGSIGTGFRSALFSNLADTISGKIRLDYFASITRKDTAFFDVTKVGEIRKSIESL